jgi:UDP-N-acetylmuramate dehydrogenase
MRVTALALPIEELRAVYGERLQEQVSLARYTSARLGGPADAFLEVHSADDLAGVVNRLWKLGSPFVLLGSGSNVLVSDAGVRAVVVLNKARAVRYTEDTNPPSVWAESGANFGAVARQAAQKSFAGLEWAIGIPGTLGGAVVGNAGAHGGDLAGNLMVAEILHRQKGRHSWSPVELEFGYRSSALKHAQGEAVVLSATLQLERGTVQDIKEKMDAFISYRRQTQPPGASMGSMFKNPPEDYAGRLIEAAGLKGTRVGDAQISPLHANFFINLGNATASDVMHLIQKSQVAVAEEFGIDLELEIELVGEWI